MLKTKSSTVPGLTHGRTGRFCQFVVEWYCSFPNRLGSPVQLAWLQCSLTLDSADLAIKLRLMECTRFELIQFALFWWAKISSSLFLLGFFSILPNWLWSMGTWKLCFFWAGGQRVEGYIRRHKEKSHANCVKGFLGN